MRGRRSSRADLASRVGYVFAMLGFGWPGGSSRGHWADRHPAAVVEVLVQSIVASIRRRPILAFFVMAYVFAWAMFPLILVSQLFGLLALFVPAVAAILTSAAVGGRAQVRMLLNTITAWRVKLLWYVVALGLPILLSLALLMIAVLMGSAAEFQLAPVSPLALIVFILVIGEELGWRGYAQPNLEMRHSAVTAAMLVGILWGFWHLPTFFIPGLPQADVPLAAFILFTTAFSVLSAWLLRRSIRSVLIATLFHAAFNTFAFLTPSLSAAERWWFIAGTYALTALVVVALLGRDLTGRSA